MIYSVSIFSTCLQDGSRYTVVSYLYVILSGFITLAGEKIFDFLLSITRNNVVSFKRGFFFLLMLMIGDHIHYENTPMQYIVIFHGCKNNNFQMKIVIFFLFLLLT